LIPIKQAASIELYSFLTSTMHPHYYDISNLAISEGNRKGNGKKE
jgi:hypothetical protein